MRWNEDALYIQFLQRDPAYNGKFLTGVLTTGIYCLPSCPARRPKRENIRFFHTPDEAVKFGLRPCRRCHPDSFYRGEEWHENLFEQTAARVRHDPASFRDISDLIRASGLSRTALSDLFREHAQESPAAFLRRVRIDHVKALLREGHKPTDAAASAGFDSSSSFHEQFAARTGLTPGAYSALRNGDREFVLRLPPGFRTAEALRFYGRDARSTSESAAGSTVRKCLTIDSQPILIEIEFRHDAAVCHTDSPDVFGAHHAAVRMLGIDSDAAAFERQFSGDPLLGGIVSRQRGLRIPLTPDGWEALAWAIMGQQISVKFAVALRRELILAAGTKRPGGLYAHPSAEAVAALDVDTLRKLKFSGSKAEYLLAAARSGLPLESLREMSARHAARMLGGIRGVGPWTVQYAFLRGLGFADSLPSGDAGLAQGLAKITGERPQEPEIRGMLARFAPYRSFATYHIWASLKGEQENAI